MTDLEILLAALVKIIWNFKVPLIYTVVGLAVLWRREKFEKETMAEIIERDKLKRINNQKYSA